MAMERVVLNMESSKGWHIKKQLEEAVVVESRLNMFMSNHVNSEIVAKTIESKQDCIDWLTWTFFYRRLN